MLERPQDSYPLLRQFREFYLELSRLRRLAECGVPVQEDSAEPANPVDKDRDRDLTPGEKLTRRIWNAMANYLDERMFAVRTASSTITRDLTEELVYIMAAFADETFLCLITWRDEEEWHRYLKDYWKDNLMELRLFRSQISGQVIFRRIDELLSRQDYGSEELCAVYLMCLSLGFKGQYLHEPEVVEHFRKMLFDRLALSNPELRRNSSHLFPDAYLYTNVQEKPVRLPEPGKWWLGVAFLLLAWLGLSSFAWWKLTRPTVEELALTQKALQDVDVHRRIVSADRPTLKWESLPMRESGQNFRFMLPSNLEMAVRNGAATVSPLTLVEELASDCTNATLPNLDAWLGSGTVSFPDQAPEASRSRPLAGFAREPIPPSGIPVSGPALVYEVETGLSQEDLARQPWLVFPRPDAQPASGSCALTGLKLYVPDRPSRTSAGVP